MAQKAPFAQRGEEVAHTLSSTLLQGCRKNKNSVFTEFQKVLKIFSCLLICGGSVFCDT